MSHEKAIFDGVRTRLGVRKFQVLAGHSLRSGHATTAASRGANDRAIMRQTGHRTRRTLDLSSWYDNGGG